MKIHNFSRWAITFMLVLQFLSLNAQFSVDAGRGLIVCISANGIQNTYSLGGSPTIRQGVAPFKIEWSANHTWAGMKFSASTFLNDTAVANPFISAEANFLGNNNMVKFYLKVTDANQNVRFDSTVVRFSRFGILPIGGPMLLPRGDSLKIYSGIFGGITPIRYSWTPNYNISDTSVSAPIVWPRRNTTYSCRVVDSAGCNSGFNVDWVISVITNTDDLKQNNQVSISPNPLTDVSVISIKYAIGSDAVLNVSDISGRTIYSQKVTTQQIPIGKFIKESGLYVYYLVEKGNIVAVGKFSKP